MQTKTPARETRETNSTTVARELRRSLAAHDIDQSEFGRSVGVRQQHVAKWCSADEPHSIPLHDLMQAPTDVVLDMLRLVAARHGLAVVPADEASSDPASMETLHGVMSCTTALALTHADALTDGHISAAEAARIAEDADRVISAATRLANGARAVAKEHARGSDGPRAVSSLTSRHSAMGGATKSAG